MKDRKRYFLKDAIVLMIVSAMVLSAIPAVTASDFNLADGTLTGVFKAQAPSGILNKYDTTRPLPVRTPNMAGGFGSDNWISYNDGYTENSLGLTAGGEITMAIQLTDTELSAYRGQTIDQIFVSIGADAYAPGPVDPFEVWIETSLPADPYSGVNIVASGTTTSAVWQYIDVTDYVIPASGDLYIGVNVVGAAGEYPLGIDESTTTPARAGLLTYSGYGTWTDIGTIGFPGVWGLDVGVVQGGPPPVGECLPDQCDFELVSINNIYPGPINSLPQVINITIRNNGEVGIAELKLLADIYEKVCGPTTEICAESTYDLCDWEAQAAADWSWVDDGDGDTFVYQGGEGYRWLTDGAAWRNTAGKDRSYGGDEDVYLGLSPDAVGFDELIWHCADSNDISGAACATFTFNHWAEGEYFVDCNGDTIPVDYGTISYSLDNGVTWVEIPIADFVAYDTEGQWQKVTIKFINSAIYDDTSYADVCDDCEPAEGDIVIEGAFPDVANLQMKFTWHKDPCLQFEGWYIDDASLTRTEMYELILVHQTHDIIELAPCVGEPVNIFYEFPLGFDPEPDTWYQICILGQVFDCPDCCEQIFDNNEKCVQFFVTDIHDVACVGNEILDPQAFYHVGDSVCVNVTVKNMGTFAENNVPVDLKIGKSIIDKAMDESAETDPMDNWDFYYFTGSSPDVYFRWTQGDSTIDKIGDGRSVLPGDESIICAEQGFLYPYLPNGAGCGMADPSTYDLSDVLSANLNFYAKWSIPANQDCDGDGYVDSFWGVLVHPTSGPDSAYWWFAGGTAYMNYQNDWQYMSYDLKAEAESHSYTSGTETIIPEVEYMIGAFMCTEDGNTVPVGNPIPWSGLMVDNIVFEIASCGPMEVVDTQYTGSLAPGQTQTLTLCWDDAEYCNWCECKDVNLPGDVNTENDVCCGGPIKVRETTPLENWNTWDLTDQQDDCLWHICCTRSCDGTCCLWAGIEEETSGHYIPDMDDSAVSPVIDLSDYTAYGVSLNLTTWYNFCGDEGDFGQIYIRKSASSPWVLLNTIEGDSGGFFEELSFWVDAEYCTSTFQVMFRMVSDSDDCVCEGWYVCEVQLVEITAIGTPPGDGFESDAWIQYTDGHTDNAFCWTDLTDWCEAAEFTDAQLNPGGYRSFNVDELSISVGCDDYGFYAAPFDVYVDNSLAAVSTRLASNSYDATFIGSATGWTNVVLPGSGIPIPDSGSLIVAINFHDYSGYPAGFDTSVTNPLGGWVLNHASLTDWIGLADLGYSAVWGIKVGISEGIAPIAWGEIAFSDTFDRLTMAPWTCISMTGGNYWDTTTQCISGYPGEGKGLNDAMYTKIDLTDPELTYAEFYFTTEWDMEDGVCAYIEISPDWDGVSPMQDATWVPFWQECGPSVQGLITSQDLVPDDRFVINEYLGETIYLRFRYTTPGEGFEADPDGFWCIHEKQIIYKEQGIAPPVDTEPPVTNAFFDCITAKVTLLATDYPLLKNCGVKATYYKIDSGDFLLYTQPFAIPEGTHTVYFYSVDNCGNTEATKSKTYTVDTTPPTVQIIVPEEGALYLFGSKIMNRILSDKTLCIGKVPVEATASDGTGSGINKVLFAFDGASAWDESSPYTAVYKEMHFGSLVITATALDNVGLESAPDTMTVTVYSLGLF